MRLQHPEIRCPGFPVKHRGPVWGHHHRLLPHVLRCHSRGGCAPAGLQVGLASFSVIVPSFGVIVFPNLLGLVGLQVRCFVFVCTSCCSEWGFLYGFVWSLGGHAELLPVVLMSSSPWGCLWLDSVSCLVPCALVAICCNGTVRLSSRCGLAPC